MWTKNLLSNQSDAKFRVLITQALLRPYSCLSITPPPVNRVGTSQHKQTFSQRHTRCLSFFNILNADDDHFSMLDSTEKDESPLRGGGMWEFLDWIDDPSFDTFSGVASSQAQACRGVTGQQPVHARGRQRHGQPLGVLHGSRNILDGRDPEFLDRMCRDGGAGARETRAGAGEHGQPGTTTPMHRAAPGGSDHRHGHGRLHCRGHRRDSCRSPHPFKPTLHPRSQYLCAPSAVNRDQAPQPGVDVGHCMLCEAGCSWNNYHLARHAMLPHLLPGYCTVLMNEPVLDLY